MKYSGKRIIFSVLNWGLGHATRSIPLIQDLIDNQNSVTIACSGNALLFLKEVFPENEFVELPDYGAQYRWNNMAMNIAMQAPTMFKAVLQEKEILQQLHEKDPFDAAISDQRYGCYLENVPSFFITHQLFIKARKRLTSTMANKLHQSWMRNFNEIWVPDTDTSPGLAGELSHTEIEQKTYYIGPLSRFANLSPNGEPVPSEYDWLFLLSGPEPARSKLEELILEFLKEEDLRSVVIRGKSDDHTDEEIDENTRVIGHVHQQKLYDLVKRSKGVFSRSGFSTIMDMSALHRPAVLIPTPGQPEQIHLAELLSKEYRWPVFMQSELRKIPSLSCLKNALPLPEIDLDRTHNIIHRRLSLA